MTIENLKQIAIKYETTKGSRVPLAPDELCNAVVQYFNEFLKITADINTIQVAVTEEGGNIVFTITGNTLDGKAFTPIVITVDHNDFVTNQEFEEFKTSVTKQLNNKRSVISSPASSYVVYTQANGLESNLPYSELANQTSTNIMARRANGTSDVKKGISGENVANMQNIADVEAKIPDVSNFATKDEIPDVSGFATKSELSNKLDISGGTINGNLTVAGGINTAFYKSRGAEVIDLDFSNTRFNVGNTRYGINIFSSNRPTVTIGESISNIALENDIPDVSNFPTLSDVNTFTNQNIFKTNVIVSGTLRVDTNSFLMGLKLLDSKIISGSSTVTVRDLAGTMALLSDIPAYTTVDSVSYDTTNGAIIAYDGANEIHIPLLAGENVTIDASEDNKKIVISAAGGGGTGDVTAAGNNTFTGKNTFTNEITFNIMKSEAGYIQFGNFNFETTEGYNYLFIDDNHINIQKFVGTDNYYELNINADLINYKPEGNNVYEFHFPNKSGIFALTSDVPNLETLPRLGEDNTYTGTNYFKGETAIKSDLIIENAHVTNRGYGWDFPLKSGTIALTSDIKKEPIYFISFYANEPSEPCHLIGTMMSKNSYGTGQKTNEEFAVMLADNLYTNSNEGLATYGRLAEKDILCIYSEDGLSIRCLDEENSEVDLPTVMFFVMETEL